MKVNIKDKDGLTEEEFIKAYNPARYERPSVTNDIIIFTTEDNLYGVIDVYAGLEIAPEYDETAKRVIMKPVEGTEREVSADLVLIAAGFLGCEGYITDSFGVECNTRTNVKTAAGSYQTNIERVFTAGDMHRGQSLVVWAIAEGRAAAKEVDESMMGYTNL